MELIVNAGNLVQRKVGSPEVFISENGFYVKQITSKHDMVKAHRLRHQIFSQELKWVPETEDMMEIDEYDRHALSFGVFSHEHGLKAYLRIVLSENSYMLEKEFPFLVKEGTQVRKERDTVEISRLCVAPDARTETVEGNFGVHAISMLLYKGVYHWCLREGKRYIILVVDRKVFRLLRFKGFPCMLIGDPKIMPDGVVAVAAIMDWREFEAKNRVARPDMMAWFSQYGSGRQTRLSPPHEFYLRHRALP